MKFYVASDNIEVAFLKKLTKDDLYKFYKVRNNTGS